jgi:carnitine O-acetyltransferase
MLRFEASLPRLPVPPLSSTTAKYLETVRPHLSDAEYSKTQDAVKAFMDSPLAHDLQKRLEARAADPNMKNWLADWWNDVAYMAYRDPVVVYVSYYYLHLDDKRVRSPAKKAAQLVKAMLPFREMTER